MTWDSIDLDTARARRHALHRIPELGFALPSTAAFVARALRAAGLEVTEGVGRSGVVAVARGAAPGPVVALRADMDALPIDEQGDLPHASRHAGRMHACGHDGHMATLLSVADAVARMRIARGAVVFVFQPAEEHGRGAEAMIADGLVARFAIDEFFAFHNMPGLAEGTIGVRDGAIMGAEDNFRIRLTGRGGHSSRPDRVEDPIVPGAQLALALQSIVSRHLDPREPAVLSITGIATDGARNVLPGSVTLDGDVRHMSDAVSRQVEARMRALAEGLGRGFGMSVDMTYARVFAPTINDAATTATARAAAARAVGPARVTEVAAETASEDVGRFFALRPGTLVFVGNGIQGRHGRPLHAADYDFNDAILGPAAGFFLEVLADRLGLTER